MLFVNHCFVPGKCKSHCTFKTYTFINRVRFIAALFPMLIKRSYSFMIPLSEPCFIMQQCFKNPVSSCSILGYGRDYWCSFFKTACHRAWRTTLPLIQKTKFKRQNVSPLSGALFPLKITNSTVENRDARLWTCTVCLFNTTGGVGVGGFM